MLRRIAYAETKDGADSRTYSSKENGGIWRVSESKYAATKDTSSNRHLEPKIQAISTTFGIKWLSTNWTDLRKPFYSALAARLYMLVITQSIPLASNINGQGTYWANYFTSSGGTQSDYVTAVNELLTLQNCSVNALDLYFVMDASGSVGSSNFQLMKNFVYNIANSFNVGSDSVRVGVMSYGSSNSYHFHLNTYTTKSSVLTAINNLPYSGGYTYTADALDGMRTVGFSTSNGARPTSQGVPRVGIVITDGQSTNPSATLTAANNVHNAGIIVFAIGIAGANQNELNAIASQSSYVSFLSSFSLTLLNSLQYTISQESCVTSPDVNLGETISDNIGSGETKYLNYPLPNNDQGITIVLNVTNGAATLYASTVVSTPNEAFHDVQITTDRYEDVYIDPANLTNPSSADTVYIAIEGTRNSASNQVQVSATQGDTSTDPVAIEKFTKTNFSKNYGATVTVVCRASGKPLPSLTWNKGGVLITASNVNEADTIISNTTIQSVITITNINFDNDGTYQCVGTNTLPGGLMSYSQSFTLTVVGLIVSNFTGIPISSTSIYLIWALPIGYTAQYYLVNVDELETNHSWTFHAVESRANIISLHPYYTYRCSVAVVLNETYPYSGYIFVTTHPSAPTGVVQFPILNPTSSSELNVTWMAPPLNQQNGIISYYIVVITERATNIAYHNTTSLTWFYYFNLHPYYEYSIDIAAVTIDIGPFLTGINVTMPESAPSTSPIDVHAANINSYSVNISWLPPPANNQNGIIRWYEVLIYEPESEIFNLTVSTTYAVVTVSAYTVSNGPYSEWITVTTSEDAPSAPPNDFNATVTSPYSALLTWDPPPNDQKNGVIISYVINVVILETGENFTLYSNTTLLFVDGLRPFRTFECIIAAVTNVGVGPYSAIFTLSTPQDAPSSSPVQVRSTSVTSRSISLYWDPPSYDNQNGIINYYIIRIIEVETGVTSEYTSYTTVLSLSSLHPAYTYYCSIAAYTVALGPFSIQFNITTNEDVPSQSPVNFVGSVLSSSSVSLSWNPPPADSQNGIIISYHLNLTTLATGSVSLYTSYDTTIQVNGLVPYTTYTCLIAAETSIGRGPYTTIITFTTMEDAPTSSPIIISHSVIDSHSVAIHWNPPISYHNGIIRNYIVHIVEMSGDRNAVRVYNTTATTVVIGSLIPSYAYKFFIAASTVAIGPYTSFVITLPEDIPSGYPKELDVNDTTSDSFTLTWDSLPYEEQSGDIIGYVVNVTHADTLSTVQYHTVVTSILITGLDPYTTYVCVVAAETSVGVGPFSHLFFVQTDEAAPDSPPQHPNAIALSPTSIHITWDPPLLQDHNGVIREYRINVTEAVTSTFTEHVINQTQLVVTGLKPFHLYYCSIVAVTIDEGPYTISVSVLTEEAAPSMPPQSLSVSITSSRSLFMSWDIPPVESHNGIIREYSVIIQTVLTQEEQTYTTLNKFFNATGLVPYTTYRVKVAAVTVEAGPFTVSHNITTFEDNPTSPPESFNATATDASSLFLQWAPPSAEGVNGVIQHYNISITEVETGIVTHYITTSVSYTLTDLHPFYTYKCTVVAVTIGAGPITSVTVQMPEDVPSTAPKNVLNTKVTSKSLTINWEALHLEDQNGLVRHYLINVTETDTGSQFQYTSTTTDVTLADLHPYYTYSISVSAFTIAAGPLSDPIIILTAQDVPSSPPIDIITSSITSTAATLQWLPPSPSERNGIIIGYNITIEDSLSGIEQDVLYSLRPILTINFLEPYTMYQYSIAAVTTVGQGPYSTFLLFQTNEAAPSEAPGSLSVVYITSTTVTLTWDPPPLDSHNGVIREYTVRLTGSDDQFFYNATKNSITIPDLLPYTDYEISVSAYTVANGPFSSYLSVTSDEAVPSASPSMVSVTAINPSTLSLSWNPLASYDANGIVREYIVNVFVQDLSEHYQYSTVNTSLLLTELHPYYTYTVYVAAVTIGRGPFSAGSSIRMPQNAPSGLPNNLTILPLNSTAVQVFWDPPHLHLQNGVITSYTIILLELRTNTSQLLSQNSLYTTVIISGLHPYYDYSISVAAYTVGVGPASITTVRTLQDVPSVSPQSLRVNILTSTTINIVWLPPHPTQQNGLISHYTVVLYAKETRETLQYNTTQSFIKLSALHPFYNYVCHVATVTIGPGPRRSISFQMQEDVPQRSPQNLTVTPLNQSTILIGWFPPAISLQNGIIRSYTIYIFHNLTGLADSYTVFNRTTHIVKNLKPFSVYSISVAASTVGIGPFTSLIPVMLPEGVPSLAPSQFIAEFVSNGSVLFFSWIQLPIDDVNGILLGYQLSCSGQNDHTFSDAITGTSAYAYDVDKNTHYTCQVCAFTSIGCGPTAMTHISTYENSPVGPPHSLSANTTSTTIHLYWEAPLDPDSVILSYVVSYYLLSTSFLIETPRPRVSVAGINETSHLISSLLVSSTYQIEVFAVTKEGSTLPTSEPINVTTSSLDSNSPKNFTCLAKSATSLKCTWFPPENLNYNVESYNISYRLAEGFDYFLGYGKVLGTINLHASTLEYSITGLQPYGGYVVELEAFLLPTIGSGYSGSQPFVLDEIKGPVTTIAVTNPETPLAAVENVYITVLISNAINVSWKPPKRKDWNGRIDFYKLILTLHDDVDLGKRAEPTSREILVKPTSNHPDPSLAKEPLQPESSLIEGLEENFEYSLTIVIYNAAGNGIVSEPTTQKMPQAAPSGPPVNVTLKSVTTNTFNITWLPPNPLDANGVITGYHVIFNRTRFNDISSYMLTASHNYFFKKGLHSYEMVSFKVAAKTNVGFGPFSSEFSFRTNEEIPNPPLLLRASLYNVSSVLLKWESIGNEPVIEYEVFYTGYSQTTSDTDGPQQSLVLYSKISQIVIVNLMAGYLYQFTVRARNNAGVSVNTSVLIRIPAYVGEVSGDSDGFSTFIFYIPIAFALLIFSVCTIIIIVIIVFFKKNRSKRKQKFEPSMTNNPLDLALSGDNFQHEPTNTVEETNPNSMSLNESMNCENIESSATDDPTNIDHA